MLYIRHLLNRKVNPEMIIRLSIVKKCVRISILMMAGILFCLASASGYAQGSIPVGEKEPPPPPKPGEEFSWITKWCSLGWREYGWDHMARCERLINRPSYVLSSYGCGTGCRINNRQVEPPHKLSNGWLRVPVFSEVWLSRYNPNTETWTWRNEGFRSGPATRQEFWFAQCKKGLFGEGESPDVNEASVSSVYIEKGDLKGQPKLQTVHAGIYRRWQKLCSFGSGN